MAQRKIYTCQKHSGDQFRTGFVMLLRLFISFRSSLIWNVSPFTFTLVTLLLSVKIWSFSFFTVYLIELSLYILSFTKHSYLSSPIFWTSKNLSVDGWDKTFLVKILNTPSVLSKTDIVRMKHLNDFAYAILNSAVLWSWNLVMVFSLPHLIFCDSKLFTEICNNVIHFGSW